MMGAVVGMTFWKMMYAVGWSAVQFLWQGAAIGGLAFLISRISGSRMAPAHRYRLFCITLLALVSIPLVSILKVVLANQESTTPEGMFLHVQSVDPLVSALGWIGLLWVGVACCRLGVLAARVVHVCRFDVADAPPSLTQAYSEARRAMETNAEARIAVSNSLDTPQVIGWRRPTILIPARIQETLTRAQLTTIIMHELAHVERRDPWVNLAQCLAEAVVPHPAVAWVSTQIRDAREFCCDQRVVRRGATRVDYAWALHRTALLGAPGLTLSAAATGGSVLGRIEALASGARDAGLRLPARLAILALIGASYGFTMRYEPIPIRMAHAPLKSEAHIEFPDTPAGNTAREWFAAMQSRDSEVLARFFEDNSWVGDEVYDPAEDIASHEMVLRNTGGILAHSIMRSDEHEIVILAAGVNGNWIRVTIGVQPERPHKIITLSIRRSAGPEAEAVATAEIQPELQKRVAAAAASLLRARYVFADVGAAYGEALDRELAQLDQPLTAEQLATRLTRMLRQVQPDQHLAILDPGRAERIFMMYGEPESEADPEHEAAPEQEAAPEPEAHEGPEPDHEMELSEESHHGPDMGTGFNGVEFGTDGIALVAISSFTWYPAAKAEAEEVMSSIQDAEAIVFDLRGNGGGDGQMVDLIESYFFAEPTHIMSSIRRSEDGSQTTEDTWTVTNALSGKMSSIPVFILIDVYTGSAAEAFAFGMKHAGRATLIGQTSAGAGHRVSYERLPGGFALGLPIGAAVNPATGRGWEGVGVTPDFEIPVNSSLEVMLDVVRSEIR